MEKRFLKQQTNITKLKFFIFVYFLFWGGFSIFLTVHVQPKYLTIFYLLFVGGYIFGYRKFPTFNGAVVLKMYLLMLLFALFFHSREMSSILNVGMLFISVLAIALLAWLTLKSIPSPNLELFYIKILFLSIVLLTFLSCFLTGIRFPGVPDYYPWEAFYTEKRLLILAPSHVGHSIILWLLSLLGIFILTTLKITKRGKFLTFVYISLIVILLLATKTRLSLLFSFLLAGACIVVLVENSWLSLYTKSASIFILFSFVVFLILPFSFNTYTYLSDVLINIQEKMPYLRIVPERGSIISGRDTLSVALLNASLEHPILGMGNKAPILAYGIDNEGNIALSDEDKLASSESSIRLAVKYGWPFYFFTIFMFLSPTISFIFSKDKKNSVLLVFLSLVAIMTFIFEGGFENYYGGQGAILLYLFMVYYLKSTISGEFKKRKRHIQKKFILETNTR